MRKARRRDHLVLRQSSPHPSQFLFVEPSPALCQVRDLFIDNLLVQIHYDIVMIRWTGLAPWEFEFPFPGSLTSSFLELCQVTSPAAAVAPQLDRLKGTKWISASVRGLCPELANAPCDAIARAATADASTLRLDA